MGDDLKREMKGGDASCCLYSALDRQPATRHLHRATLHRANNHMAVRVASALVASERHIG